MKPLIVIFALCIYYVLCEGNKVAIKSFPKKVRPYGNGKILINSAKYEFKAKHNSKPTTAAPNTYTVFQVVGIPKTIQGVPDSPYFPVDQGFVHKPRVKKVLPDYAWSSIRSKRSAVNNEAPKEKDDKVETTTPALKDSELGKIKETPTTASNLDKEEPKRKNSRKLATMDDTKLGETNDAKGEIRSSVKVHVETTKETEPSKNVERSLDRPTTKTQKSGKKDDLARVRKSESKSDKKDEPKKLKLVDVRSNKKSQSRPDGKGDVKNTNGKTKSKSKASSAETSTVNAKVTNAERTKPKAKSKDKGKDTPAVARAKPKPKGKKTAVANVRAKNVNGANAKAKKSAPKTRANTGGSKKKDKKRKGNAKNKAAPQRTKNRSRPKKGQKQKEANGKRAGKKPKAERRLIAAREALIEDYPYVVSIQKDDQHWCSGALLNPRLVITTANCLWKANRVSRMEVRAGSRYTDRGGQVAGIQEVMKHPGWGLRKSPNNDVALVVLDRNIKFSHSVHGVDLPNRVMMPAFDDAWVTSWGAERRDGVYDVDSTALQVFHTRLMDRDKCNNITMRFSVIVSENFICLSQSGKTAPCTRDTGAPAVSDGILWGLASWGIRKLCGTERFPAMFSYLASHSNLDFITNASIHLMGDKRFYPFADRYPNLPKNSPE